MGQQKQTGEYQKIAIQEIAKQLGLSATTVSRALSGKGRIGQETQQKIALFLEENHYIPNITEKVKKHTGNICVLLPGEEGHAMLPYFQEVLLSIHDYFAVRKYGVLIAKTTAKDIQELKNLVEEHKIDGVILTRIMEEDEAIQYLKKKEIPFAVIGSWNEDSIVQVDFDQEGGCRDLTSVLLRMNIRKIACIGGDKTHIVTQKRMRGIKEAFFEAKIELEQELIYTEAVYPSIVEKDVMDLLEKDVECILCLDDNICLAVMNALHKNNIQVPSQMKVASCYGGRMLANCYPAITCLEFNIEEMGKIVSKKLLDIMQGNQDYAQLNLGYNVLIKDSTK